MNKNLLVLLYFAILSGPVFGFQWPVDNPAVTATFGESRWNHFHGGIDIGGGEQEIRPIEDGEVIFYFEEREDRSGIPTGLGNFIVVEHDRGIRSLYAHLKPGSIDSGQVFVSKDDVLGVIGETGSSLGRHLHFEVSDGEFHQLVNPMRLLPELPDSLPPVIGLTLLVPQTGVAAAGTVASADSISLESATSISSGNWHVLLEVYDVSEYVNYFCPLAPYQVQVYLNGQKVLSVVFDGLEENSGSLHLGRSDGVSFSTFYLDEWLFDSGVISIPEGAVKIEVVASDYAGNEASKMFSLDAVRG